MIDPLTHNLSPGGPDGGFWCNGITSTIRKGAYNSVMRCRLAPIVVFVTSSLLVGRPHVHAQSSDSTASCQDSVASDDNDSPGPEISIVDVTFSGSLQMYISEQEEIANSIKQKTHGKSLDDVTEEGLERVRAGWQDLGLGQSWTWVGRQFAALLQARVAASPENPNHGNNS